jgi:hypothetical protein
VRTARALAQPGEKTNGDAHDSILPVADTREAGIRRPHATKEKIPTALRGLG